MTERILSKRMIVPLFMPFAFIGLMSLFFGGLLLFIDSHPSFGRSGTMFLVGIVSLWISGRQRVTRFDDVSGEITLSWGLKQPLVYKRFTRTDWLSFKVEKRYPVVVTPTGSGSVRTSRLPPYWAVHGLTKHKKSVFLAECKTEADAVAWRGVLAKSSGLALHTLMARVSLSQGNAQENWKSEPFFKKDKQAAKLYAQICASGDWDYVHAGNSYDMDAHEELGISHFDIPLLASNEQITKPWRVMLRLEQAGWVASHEGEITPLAELEKKLPWVTVDLLSKKI